MMRPHDLFVDEEIKRRGFKLFLFMTLYLPKLWAQAKIQTIILSPLIPLFEECNRQLFNSSLSLSSTQHYKYPLSFPFTTLAFSSPSTTPLSSLSS